MSKKFINPMDYIHPLNVNGLECRYLFIPARSKRIKSNLLIIYDLNSNIEKWFGYLTALSRFSNITMIDLPGLGGADSFFSIGICPNLDNMVSYLSSVIKLKFRRKKLSILGIGYGFAVVTKMLQDNPDILSKVNNLISINGYTHFEDFNLNLFNKIKIYLNYIYSKSKLMTSMVASIRKSNYYLVKKYDDNFFKKYLGVKFPYLKQFAIDLDKSIDFRTENVIKFDVLKLDLCSHNKINKPLWVMNVAPSKKYLSNRAEQHLKVIYSNYNYLNLRIRKMPYLINDEKFGLKLIPHKLKDILKKQ